MEGSWFFFVTCIHLLNSEQACLTQYESSQVCRLCLCSPAPGLLHAVNRVKFNKQCSWYQKLMQIELPFLYKQRCLCSVCIFRVLHKYNNTVNYNFCADYWLWAQWELLIWKTLGCQFGLLIMSQYLYVVIKLFPINFCVGYLGVALRYLTVWSGSWWNNLFFFFFFFPLVSATERLSLIYLC